jgi:hypothetical protein
MMPSETSGAIGHFLQYERTPEAALVKSNMRTRRHGRQVAAGAALQAGPGPVALTTARKR